MDQQRLRELARKGLELERRELEELGRELAGGGKRKGDGAVSTVRTKPKWTAAQKKAISDRMTRYWAKRRAAAKKG